MQVVISNGLRHIVYSLCVTIDTYKGTIDTMLCFGPMTMIIWRVMVPALSLWPVQGSTPLHTFFHTTDRASPHNQQLRRSHALGLSAASAVVRVVCFSFPAHYSDTPYTAIHKHTCHTQHIPIHPYTHTPITPHTRSPSTIHTIYPHTASTHTPHTKTSKHPPAVSIPYLYKGGRQSLFTMPPGDKDHRPDCEAKPPVSNSAVSPVSNPFTRLGTFATSKVSSLLHSLIGLPSSTGSNSQWALDPAEHESSSQPEQKSISPSTDPLKSSKD
jgi:hypothetical protein